MAQPELYSVAVDECDAWPEEPDVPRVRVERLDEDDGYREVPLDYMDADYRVLECVVGMLRDGSVAWVDAWLDGERAELTPDLRDAIATTAVRGW